MVDHYTKAVLTVIAAALVALVVQNAAPDASAQIQAGCGDRFKPCYVTTGQSDVLRVTIVEE